MPRPRGLAPGALGERVRLCGKGVRVIETPGQQAGVAQPDADHGLKGRDTLLHGGHRGPCLVQHLTGLEGASGQRIGIAQGGDEDREERREGGRLAEAQASFKQRRGMVEVSLPECDEPTPPNRRGGS